MLIVLYKILFINHNKWILTDILNILPETNVSQNAIFIPNIPLCVHPFIIVLDRRYLILDTNYYVMYIKNANYQIRAQNN